MSDRGVKMKKKYVIWSLLAFFLSVLLGSVTFNIAHPYFRGEKTLHNKETEDNPNIIEGDQNTPLPDGRTNLGKGHLS